MYSYPFQTDNERTLIALVAGAQEKDAVAIALHHFQNADKVMEVLRISGKLNIPHASYTLCPIIYGIGDRTPEQYVADVNAAIERFSEQQRDYIQKMLQPKSKKRSNFSPIKPNAKLLTEDDIKHRKIDDSWVKPSK